MKSNEGKHVEWERCGDVRWRRCRQLERKALGGTYENYGYVELSLFSSSRH